MKRMIETCPVCQCLYDEHHKTCLKPDARFDLIRPDGTVAFEDCTANEALYFTSGKLKFLMIVPSPRNDSLETDE